MSVIEFISKREVFFETSLRTSGVSRKQWPFFSKTDSRAYCQGVRHWRSLHADTSSGVRT